MFPGYLFYCKEVSTNPSERYQGITKAERLCLSVDLLALLRLSSSVATFFKLQELYLKY